MKIDLKCRCGAAATFHSGEFIHGGGQKDDKGRVFVVEQRAEEWMERHQPCLNTELAQRAEQCERMRGGKPVTYWRDSALEASAQIAEAYHSHPGVAADIRAMKSAAGVREDGMADLIEHDAMGLLKALPALQRDAARYRRLRSTTNHITSGGRRIELASPEELDAAIDRCIATAGVATDQPNEGKKP